MNQNTAVSFRQKILSKEIKRAHAMQARYEDLHVEEGFNLRTPVELLDGPEREKAEADDESLFQHIMSGGRIPPLETRPRAEGGVWIVDGHRRHKQIGRAIAAGAPLPDEEGVVWIDVVAFVGNDADRTARIISSAQGRHLTPLETAFGYAKLAGFKWEPERIARLEQVSPQWVGKMIALAHANSDVHALIRAGVVTASTAVDAVSKHGEGAGAYLQSLLHKAKASGKTKVTPAAIHGRALPRKVVSPLISGVDSFMRGLDANQRATLLDVQEGRVAAQTITVNARDLLELFSAHGAVETVRAKRAEREQRAAETPAPDQQPDMLPQDEEGTAE